MAFFMSSNTPDLERGSHQEFHEESEDFDDSANFLWSQYGKEAKLRDEATIQRLKDDMDGAGLFSNVLTAFVVPKIQDLQVNSANQSAYYQQQSVQILTKISQQIASINTQSSVNPTAPPMPYPTFHPSSSNLRVNIYWLTSLVCSLAAALLATLVQQWARDYLRAFQRYSSPLRTVRVQMFLFEGVERLQAVAEVVPVLIHLSLTLFFFGLVDAVLDINIAVGITTIAPIAICGCLYLYSVVAPLWNPQSPYRSRLSLLIWRLIQNLHHALFNVLFHGGVVKHTSMEARQEHLAMKLTEARKARDIRVVEGLFNNFSGNDEKETLVLAIPGSFNQEWGREVWKAVVRESVVPTVEKAHHRPRPRKGTTVYEVSNFVQNVFETYNNERDPINKEVLRRRLHGFVETTASLVCCAEAQLHWFGEVGEVLSDLGDAERINEPSEIRSDLSFTVRWTCLSLVAIQQMVDSDRVRELAGFAMSGITRLQPGYGALDGAALSVARRVDRYLRTAWQHVDDIHQAFGTRYLNRSQDGDENQDEIQGILHSREVAISELERIKIEASDIDEIDWRISLLQDTMDKATHKLTRQLPGVSFNELKSGSIPIREAFASPFFESTPITPQLLFPGQQLQSLFTLGGELRDIIEGRNPERHVETISSLESIDTIPVQLRRLNYLMTRQLWRLQDLRDCGGLGFTIELFFLALRQLSSSSSSSELKKVFYISTFKIITSRRENSINSFGTQQVLLNLICDLVIKRRGLFSGFSYPEYIVDMLLELVGKMIDGRRAHEHISDAVQELRNVDFGRCMDQGLRDKALSVLTPS